MEQVKSVKEIQEKIKDIEDGWMDIDLNVYQNVEKGFKKKYVLSSPEEVLEKKVGTDFDLVELERSYFEKMDYKYNTFFMIYYDSKKVFTHTFIVYEDKEKFFWFEHAWENHRGIHEYMSLYDLLTDVREKFKMKFNIKFMDLDYLCVYKYTKPKTHIGLKDLYKHCESGEHVII